MQEKLLHFIWQYQYFSPSTLSGEDNLQVIHPGDYNEHAGPDFLCARLLIGNMTWMGHVEIHVHSSDWNLHNHHLDPAYDAVILHIVWENDCQVYRSAGSRIRTIELRDHISLSVFKRYHDLTRSLWHIPCSDQLSGTSEESIRIAVERAFLERLEIRTKAVINELKLCRGDWEEVAYRLIFRFAGCGRNEPAFRRIARLLPYRLLKKHADQTLQVEALLFGVGGFLEIPARDNYHQQLISEFTFLRKKYSLSVLGAQEWQFLRMHPSNFPTRRLAAMSVLIAQRDTLFSLLRGCQSMQHVSQLLSFSLHGYWKDHYHFGKKSRQEKAVFGRQIIQTIAINVCGSLQAAYARYHRNQDWRNSAISLYKNLPGENNRYIRLWKKHGLTAPSALESQGLLQLYLSGCKERKCLDCPVGCEILKG